MANYQDSQFLSYAGQLIAKGIQPETNTPYVALEEGKVTALNQAKIHGLMPKIGDVFIHETKVFNNPIDRYVRRYDARFGAGMEQSAFKAGAADKKVDAGKCMPWGDVEVVSQCNLTNFAYNVPISIYDREIDKAVLTEEQAGSYAAQKMRTPLASIAQMKYRAWVQLISDVTDGTRSLASNTSSDATGTAVTYSPNVKGYAKAVETVGTGLIAPVARGSLAAIGGGVEDALKIAQTLEGRAADMKYAADDMNNLGVQTFISGTPLLIMEEKVLNALDAVFANANVSAEAVGNGYGYAGFPTKSFRDYVGRFAEILEIDSFASLPTKTENAKKRLGAVLMDRDALVERVTFADVESFRCTNERATGYSYQGESTLAIWEGLDSYAMLFNASA